MSKRMELLIRRYGTVMVAVLFFMIVACGVGYYILDHTRFGWPWDETMEITVDFPHSQAVTPGQGQQVTVAGVEVGLVGPVELEDGHATVKLQLEPGKVGPVYRNATVMLRPKTLIQDQSVALDPGRPDPSLPNRGLLRDGSHLGLQATQTNVNTDEVIAMLDVDTRDYLRTLLDAGGQGLRKRGGDLRELLERSEPTFRQTRTVARELASRRRMVRRLVTNLRRLSQATAAKDDELADLVDASSATFTAIGEREAELDAALSRLPGALSASRDAVRAGRPLIREAAPALSALRPAARRLGPALAAAEPLLRTGTPILRKDLRPLVREATPLLRRLRPSLRDLNRTTPNLVRVGHVLNYLANELGYNPPGREEGFLFHLAWFAHNTNSLVSVEDANGAVVRGLAQFSCSTLGTIAGTPLGALIAATGVCPP
jgi:phospholipid/cholesterol/gamma-HCH transport system substrate-binding protein